MRGRDDRTDGLFSYVSCERRVPADHPPRTILPIVDAALTALSGELAKLLRALLLQAFCSVRSERQLIEQLDDNLLFRWFVGLGVDDPVWDVTVFTKSRGRLLEGEIAAKFLDAVLDQPQVKALLSDEHFSADGRLIQAWASVKSFRPKDGLGEPPGPGRNGERDFHGEKRSNATHGSTTDPEARLYRPRRSSDRRPFGPRIARAAAARFRWFGLVLLQAIPRNTASARVTDSRVSSSNRPIGSPSLSCGTLCALLTITWEGLRRPLNGHGAMRKSGVSRSSPVIGRMVTDGCSSTGRTG